MSAESVLFLLLLGGHMLADFVFQSAALVNAKHQADTRWRAMRTHGIQVWFGHLLLMAPWLEEGAVWVAGIAAAAHLMIDAIKLRCEGWRPAPLTWFSLDQIAHLVSLGLLADLLHGEVDGLRGADASLAGQIGLLVACLAFNGRGLAFLIAEFLRRWSPEPTAPVDDRKRMGWMIGILERTLLLLLLLEGQWGAAGLVVTAKSIARFRDLDERAFSEYYLLGTLASFLGALLLAHTYRWLPEVL